MFDMEGSLFTSSSNQATFDSDKPSMYLGLAQLKKEFPPKKEKKGR